MTPLRARMIEDMTLAGFAPRTQEVYLQAVRRLAAHYKRSPDLLSEEEVRAYVLHLRDPVWRAAPSRPIMAAFGFSISGRLIATGRFFKKRVRAPRKQRLPAVLSDAEIRALLGCVRNPIHRTCFALMYACGLRIGEAATVEIASVDRASL